MCQYWCRIKHVLFAQESSAIETLLISDSLFRSKDHLERRKYVNIVDSVKENQGTVKIFSSSHVSGERKMHYHLSCIDWAPISELDALSGIAAILRFPLVEPESDDDSTDESDSEVNYDFYSRMNESKNGIKSDNEW